MPNLSFVHLFFEKKMRSSNFIPIFPRYALYSFLSQPVYFRLGQIIIE